MSPNPVTAAAVWTFTVTADVVLVGAAVLVLGWDRWCPAGTWGCPTPSGRVDRDAFVLTVLGAALLVVALAALLRGRLLLALGQVALVVVLALVAAQLLPAAYERAPTWRPQPARSEQGLPAAGALGPVQDPVGHRGDPLLRAG